VLIQAGMKDTIVPPAAAVELGRRFGTGRAEIRPHADTGRFDGFVGQCFETIATGQLGFFHRVLAARRKPINEETSK